MPGWWTGAREPRRACRLSRGSTDYLRRTRGPLPLMPREGGPPTARSGVVLPVVSVGLISPSGHVGSTARETGMGWRVDPASSTGAAS